MEERRSSLLPLVILALLALPVLLYIVGFFTLGKLETVTHYTESINPRDGWFCRERTFPNAWESWVFRPLTRWESKLRGRSYFSIPEKVDEL